MKKVSIYTFVLTLYMFNIDKQEKGYSLKMASVFGIFFRRLRLSHSCWSSCPQ